MRVIASCTYLAARSALSGRDRHPAACGPGLRGGGVHAVTYAAGRAATGSPVTGPYRAGPSGPGTTEGAAIRIWPGIRRSTPAGTGLAGSLPTQARPVQPGGVR